MRRPAWVRRGLRLLWRVIARREGERRQRAEQARVHRLLTLSLLSRHLHRLRAHTEARVPTKVKDQCLEQASERLGKRQLTQLLQEHWINALAPKGDAHDAVLRQLLSNPTRSLSMQRQDEQGALEAVGIEAAFKGVERCEVLSLERMRSFCGEEVVEMLRRCRATFADKDNCSGENGRLLRRIVAGHARIRVARDTRILSPVSLFTPISEQPLTAVAATHIEEGEPIAHYTGELIREDDVEPADNTYLYEIDPAEMRERGYSGKTLRINARNKGGVARFINDCWSPYGLPERKPNCFVALVFDEKVKLPRMVLFATATINEGEEVIVDYGPDYWKISKPCSHLSPFCTLSTDGMKLFAATKSLLAEHARSALDDHRRCIHYEEWLNRSRHSGTSVDLTSIKANKTPHKQRARLP